MGDIMEVTPYCVSYSNTSSVRLQRLKIAVNGLIYFLFINLSESKRYRHEWQSRLRLARTSSWFVSIPVP